MTYFKHILERSRVVLDKIQNVCNKYDNKYDRYEQQTGINKSLESREISRNTDLSRSLSLEKIEFSFLFLFSIMKIFRENSLSLLDLWDFEK